MNKWKVTYRSSLYSGMTLTLEVEAEREDQAVVQAWLLLKNKFSSSRRSLAGHLRFPGWGDLVRETVQRVT